MGRSPRRSRLASPSPESRSHPPEPGLVLPAPPERRRRELAGGDHVLGAKDQFIAVELVLPPLVHSELIGMQSLLDVMDDDPGLGHRETSRVGDVGPVGGSLQSLGPGVEIRRAEPGRGRRAGSEPPCVPTVGRSRLRSVAHRRVSRGARTWSPPTTRRASSGQSARRGSREAASVVTRSALARPCEPGQVFAELRAHSPISLRAPLGPPGRRRHAPPTPRSERSRAPARASKRARRARLRRLREPAASSRR